MRVSDRFHAFLNQLYAPSCAACDAPLSECEGLCAPCLESCERIALACPTCAAPISGPVAIRCAQCRLRRSSLDGCTAVYEYGGQISVALRRLKFQGRSDIAKSLKPLLTSAFDEVAAHVDMAVPMPLHRRRLAGRGFNQAQRLLLPLAMGCALPVARSALQRRRATRPQAQLRAKERAANVEGAFEASDEISGQRVLLLDDIRTTGATLRAAAWALRRAGATEVHAFVVARADLAGPC